MAKLKGLLGSTLLGKDGPENVMDNMNDMDMVALYFGAGYCPSCKAFTPSLLKWYTKFKAEGKKFEVVFISNDRNEAAFTEYFGKMPWKALPFDKKETKAGLNYEYGITMIPRVVIVDGRTGELITKNGRQAVNEEKFLP